MFQISRDTYITEKEFQLKKKNNRGAEHVRFGASCIADYSHRSAK